MARFFNRFRFRQFKNDGISKYALYAIGEILLVVIGILIALQINNWSEEAKRYTLGVSILENIKADLENDIDQLLVNIRSTNRKMADVDSIFTILNDPTNSSLEDLIKFNTTIPYVDYFLPNSGTFDEGVSSGKMSYILSDILRQQIFDYYRLIKMGSSDAVANKFVEETIIPQWGELVIPNKETLNYLGFDSKLESINMKELSRSKKYNQLLAQKHATNQHQIENWERIKKRAEAIIEEIDIEIGDK